MTASSEDRYAALAAKAEQEQPDRRGWSGDGDGDESTVVGEVVEFATVNTRNGPADLVALRLQSGEEISVWLSRSVLKSEFEQWQPKVGELVAIHYFGKKQGGSGNPYHNYKVEVDGRSKPAKAEQAEQQSIPEYDDSDIASEAALQSERDEIPF